jgi:dolichol-phosphate mannosyltransferase
VADKVLVFIPTYNERDNVDRMCGQLLSLPITCDILFMDDNSPDGTGEVLDTVAAKHKNITVLHRSGKQGIGSAHKRGIAYAYEHGYTQLVTMDCDFTHNPSDIPRLMAAADKCDLVVGSRYRQSGSLPDWNLLRKFLTYVGHALTYFVLRISGDASGAFRLYNLTRIDPEVFERVRSNSYAFFFESLFLLIRNHFVVAEIAIVLPARTYGHSKMTMREATRSARFLFTLWLESVGDPSRFVLARQVTSVSDQLVDPQNWNEYWNDQRDGTWAAAYAALARIYRSFVIRRNLEHYLMKYFERGSSLLHAGCGSGQVDTRLQHVMQITAVDISREALNLYLRNNPNVHHVEHASIFELPSSDGKFDGVYNLGVVEHFTHDEIRRILLEFYRVLRPGGTIVIFWPHRRATGVAVLALIHRLLNDVLKKPTQLHPVEVSLLSGKAEAAALLRDAGFCLQHYDFGARDLFVQAVVVGEKV